MISEDLYQYSGSYQSETGTRILIITNDQRLTYLEPATGHYRVLTPVDSDTFTAGPGFKQPEPVEITAQFVRSSATHVTQVRWTQNGQQQVFSRQTVFTYEDVAFQNGDISLAGRLTKPVTPGPHPAIVMMHGSGPASRYEFQPLTEFFASFGVASLAYDKRGSGGSGGQWQSATFQELVEDALTGVAYLQSRSDITSAQIGMWGISQGGWLVALAASQSEDIDFAISVSGPGVNPTQQEIWRVEHVLSADGFPPSVIKTALALKQRALWAWQYDGAQWNDFLVSLAQVKDESWFSYLGFTAHPHKDDLREPEFEPLPVLERISCPVLAIFGELDPYLPVKQSALDFEQALKTGENPDCTVQIIPEGNHILFRAATGGMREQPALPGFVPGYLSSMRDWLLSHVAIQRPE